MIPSSAEASKTRVPLLVWAMVALHVGLLLIGSLIRPLLQVPDERFHADMVWAATHESGWPDVRERNVGPEIELAGRLLRRERLLAEYAIPRVSPADHDDMAACEGLPLPTCRWRPELNAFSDWQISQQVNRMTQHPPLYYLAVGTISQSAMSIVPLAYDLSFDQQLWLYRLVTLLMVAPLPLLAFYLARQVAADETIQLSAAAFPLVIPGLHMRNGAMINNDNLLLLLVGVLLIAICMIATGDIRLRTTLLVGTLLGLSLLTKGLAIVMIPVVLLAYIMAYKRGSPRKIVSIRVLQAASLSFAVGGWWLLRNLIKYGTPQPGGAGLRVVQPDAGFQPNLLDWFTDAAVTNVTTFFGFFGISDPLRRVVLVGLILFVAVGLGWGLFKGRHDHRRLWLVLVPTIFMTLLLMYKSLSLYVDTALVAGENGRYFYPWLASIGLGVSGGYVAFADRLRRHGRPPTLRRYIPLAFLVLGLSLQYTVIRDSMTSFWGPLGGALTDQWESLVAWAPFPTAWLVTIATFTVLAAILSLVLTVKFAVSEPLKSSKGDVGHTWPTTKGRTRVGSSP